MQAKWLREYKLKVGKERSKVFYFFQIGTKARKIRFNNAKAQPKPDKIIQNK